MNHADPWDETARLEKQMEAELLAQLDATPRAAPKVRKLVEQPPVPPLKESR